MYFELEHEAKPIEIEWQDRHCLIPAAALPATPDPSRTYEVTCR